MKDDGTRTGFSDARTKLSDLKIQVRMPSNKIYGPYSRSEVLSFIDNGKIVGEEFILIEGEVNWRPLSSDTEFFDRLQLVLFGLKQNATEAAKKKGSETVVTNQVPSPDLRLKSSETKVESTRTSVSKNPQKAELNRGTPERALPTPALPPNSSPPTTTQPIPSKTPTSLAEKFRSNKRMPFIAIVALLLAAIIFVSLQKSSNQSQPGSGEFNLSSPLVYAQPLVKLAQDLRIPKLEIPAKLDSTDEWHLPAGFGAHVWIADLKILLKEDSLSQRRFASYWARFAWNLAWLSTVVSAVSEPHADALKKESRRIIESLESQGLLTEAYKDLFAAIFYFKDANWVELSTKLATNPLPWAAWLKEEASWLQFWTTQGQSPFEAAPSEKKLEGVAPEIISRTRVAYTSKRSELIPTLQMLFRYDPRAYHAWFTWAEYNWRVDSSGIERANRIFVTGLASLSLMPVSVQAVYWDQIAQYQSSFGRKANADRANQNIELFLKGEALSAKNASRFWDLGTEGLGIKSLMDQLLSSNTSGRFDTAETAALELLAPLFKSGSKYLVEAGYHQVFERDWERATEFFNQAIQQDPSFPDAYGGLIWVQGSQYQFDLALKNLDKIGTLTNAESGLLQKYGALLQSLGREYDEAREKFNDYLKSNPQDAMAHFWQAEMFFKSDKFGDCMKAANLSRLNAKAELRFRAEMLFFRCSVLSRVAVKDILVEFERRQERDPANIALLNERVDALVNSDLLGEALQVARQNLATFPWSYELRLKLGEVYEKRGEVDQALAFFNDAAASTKKSGEAYVRIGRLLFNFQRYSESARNFESAATLQPQYPDVFLLAARAYDKAGNVAKASEMYSREIQERPAAIDSFVEAARYMLKINAPQEVPKIFQMFRAEFQEDPRVLVHLAQAYLAMEKYTEARQAAANALAGNSKIPQAHRVLGVIYETQSDYTNARKHYEAYLALLPGAPEAGELRAKLSQPPFVN